MTRNILSSGIVAAAAALTLAAPAMACDTAKASKASMNPNATIVEVAAGNEDFSTLVAAVKAAGLAETLMGKGPFTVFAPTNEAFAKLPPGTVEELLKPENKDMLIAVLTYHVVPGKVKAGEVVKMKSAKTVQGQSVDIRITNQNKVIIDNALVLSTDIEAANGVIHVIDTVILPEDNEAGE